MHQSIQSQILHDCIQYNYIQLFNEKLVVFASLFSIIQSGYYGYSQLSIYHISGNESMFNYYYGIDYNVECVG